MRIDSLSFRLLLSTGLVLSAFFLLALFVLEQGFRHSAEQTLEEKLQIHVYSLLSVAEVTRSGKLRIPLTLREPRFSNPGSGLYAFIYRPDKSLVWRSVSAIGVDITPIAEFSPGRPIFLEDKENRFVLYYAVVWENEVGITRKYIFAVAEDSLFVSNQIERFRSTLRAWFFSVGLVLVLIQFAVLRWSLIPLRLIVKDLAAIEAGKKSSLDGRYPAELNSLTRNLNALISSERAHLERYRNTLADLSHSLKTPLAILAGCLQSRDVPKKTLQDQIVRMNEIIEYQLQKAAAKGQKKLTGKIDPSQVIKKTVASLEKVYCDKQIVFSLDLSPDCQLYCEEGDLYEIAGNLLDNAAKWSKKSVKVSLRSIKNDNLLYTFLLQVEDDGPGIAADKLTTILQRGVRADENIHGHGIGMAVVNELIGLLDGKLSGGRSELLGGMMWQVYLP